MRNKPAAQAASPDPSQCNSPISKNHKLSKIAVTFEPTIQFFVLQEFEPLYNLCFMTGSSISNHLGGKHNKASVREQIPMVGYIINIFAQILGSLR